MIPKMDPKLKEKWVTALRSGEFKQTDGMLCGERDGGGIGHCCLGVLAEISGVSRKRLQSLTKTGDYKGNLDDVRQTKLLGKWDADHGLGYYSDGSVQKYLADMNDNGKSFRRIAT